MTQQHPGEGLAEPKPVYLPRLADPFSNHLQQVATLHRLNYPTEIARLSRDEIYDYASRAFCDPNPDDNERERAKSQAWSYISKDGELQNPDGWYQPMLLDPDFYPWLHDPLDALEDHADDLPLSLYRGLSRHPGYLVSGYVGDGAFRPIADYIESLKRRKGQISEEYFHTIQSCYMRALDRYRSDPEHRLSGYVEDVEKSNRDGLLNAKDVERYNYYKVLGIKPVSVRTLGALVQSFYVALELNVPEFAAFKKPKG